MKTASYILTDVFMGCQHQGLDELIEKNARKNAAFARAMQNGDLVLFLNKARNKIKLYGYGGATLGYLKVPHGRTLSLETVNLIPATFGGSLTYGTMVKRAFAGFLTEEMAAKSYKLQPETRAAA